VAGLNLKITMDKKALDKALKDIPSKVAKPASVTAINKALKVSKKKLIRNVSKTSGVPSKLIKIKTVLYKASKKFNAGLLWINLSPVPLIKLGRATERGTGIRVGRRTVKGGFIVHMKSGHEGVFVRRGKDRLPIDEQKLKIKRAGLRAALRLRLLLPREFMKVYVPEVERRLARLKR